MRGRSRPPPPRLPRSPPGRRASPPPAWRSRGPPAPASARRPSGSPSRRDARGGAPRGEAEGEKAASLIQVPRPTLPAPWEVERVMLPRGYPRVVAVLLGAVLLASVALAARPVAAQGEGRFSPPHSDSGIDEDGDGAYDVLRLSVRVTVTVPGPFEVHAFLRDGTNTSDLDFKWIRRTLSGTSTVVLDFPGHVIRASGTDGPYVIDLALMDEWYNYDDWEAHVTGTYAASAFDAPSVLPSGPITDFGVDTDGDGLWNLLRVRLNLTAEGEIPFRGGAELDTTMWYIDSIGFTCMLPAGPQTVDLDFPGWKIREAGWDGPYTVRISHYADDGAVLATWTHFTAAYAAAEFETLPAQFAPPHDERGEDADGDGLLNSIAVDVAVSVDESGEFSVTAWVQDGLGNTWGGFFETAELSAGPQVFHFRFPTLPMLLARSDGPYNVTLLLYGTGTPLIEQGLHTTAAYSISQFDPIPAVLAPPHTDSVVDQDTPPDGLWDVLKLDVSVDVLDPGVYTLFGSLWGSSTELASDLRTTILDSGRRTVALRFSGPGIGSWGISGPYSILLTLSIGDPLDSQLDSGAHTTASYPASGFENPPSATLDGIVSFEGTGDLVAYADVQAVNYATGALAMGMSDEWGRYTLWLYQGDWVVSVGDLIPRQSDLVRVAVTAPQVTQDLVVGPVLQDDMSTALRLDSWDTAGVAWSETWRMSYPWVRQRIDLWYGDGDGVVERVELDTYASLTGPFSFAPPPSPESTTNAFLVDGQPFNLDPDSASFRLEGEGPIDNGVPLEFVGNGTYTLSGSPGPGPTHTIDVRIWWDGGYGNRTYEVTAPPGFVLTPVDPPALLEIRNASTRTITLDPFFFKQKTAYEMIW